MNINLTPEAVGRCIDEIGIGFCFARLLHQAMQHVAPVRQKLGFRTIFNLLGPLTNPAGLSISCSAPIAWRPRRSWPSRSPNWEETRTLVVCGADQLDEVSLWGTTTVFDVQGSQITEHHWTAADMGLAECRVEALTVDSPSQSAEVIRKVLAGERGPARDIVLANAGAALLTAGKAAAQLRHAVELAANAIDSGSAAKKKLEALATASQPS